MKIAKHLYELIGNTPLLELTNYAAQQRLHARLAVKLESFNPLSSVKDRAACAMIEDAERRGTLKKGGVIIEATSGNMGIGLAFVAAAKGYRIIIVMPDTMTQERRSLLAALGAELVLTPGAQGMNGAIAKMNELAQEVPGAVVLGQFENPANPEIHLLTTAEEIWRDTDGAVDIFVAGVGTGGTITGVGRGLKAHSGNVKIVGVEPAESAVLSGEKAGPHKIQGIGAGFVPINYDAAVVDEVLAVTGEEAYATARELAATEGLLAGVSSGAAVCAAARLALREENAGKLIVALLPDTGERYLSTPLFQR